jgi:hypothetical protein
MAVRVTQSRVQVAHDGGPPEVRVTNVRVQVARSLAAYSGEGTKSTLSLSSSASAVVQMSGFPAASSFLVATDATCEVRESRTPFARATSTINLTPSGGLSDSVQSTLAWLPADACDGAMRLLDGLSWHGMPSFFHLSTINGVPYQVTDSPSQTFGNVSWIEPLANARAETRFVASVFYHALTPNASLPATLSFHAAASGADPIVIPPLVASLTLSGGGVGVLRRTDVDFTLASPVPPRCMARVALAVDRPVGSRNCNTIGIVGVEIRNRI